MADPTEPRRRFAPVPIETTFNSNRKPVNGSAPPRVGPTAELTPDASPRSPSPAAKEFPSTAPSSVEPGDNQDKPRRRFAPQLIETSRRARRANDPGPATRPTDKTDITPYTKNIYTSSSRPRGRQRNDDGSPQHVPPTRRESEEEGVKQYLLDLAAKEAERQLQEAALAAFPNSRAREGGVAHFYFAESSGSEETPEGVTPADDGAAVRDKTRRKSSDEALTWWHKHMQNHAQQLARERGVDDEAMVDVTEAETLKEKEMPKGGNDVKMVSDEELDKMDFGLPPDPLWTTTGKRKSETKSESVAQKREKQEDEIMEEAPVVSDVPSLPFPTSTFKPPQPEGLGRPFGAFGMKPDSPQLAQMRKHATPPMLGKDLTFRTCPSPKWTKLEPNHPFMQHQDDLRNRDTSGNGGLWQGYCFNSNQDGTAPAPRLTGPRMLATPAVPGTPAEPGEGVVEEPLSLFSTSTGDISTTSRDGTSKSMLNPLHGLNERLAAEKAAADRAAKRENKIASEFTDAFVTQVFNYLSLGYPATACIFDEELSKISKVDVSELQKNDAQQMARGHMLEMDLNKQPKEEERCPRWKALKIYVTEWARQHPNLDNLDPLAWGVRERKGSWAF